MTSPNRSQSYDSWSGQAILLPFLGYNFEHEDEQEHEHDNYPNF
jgi:hypothetical protein